MSAGAGIQILACTQPAQRLSKTNVSSLCGGERTGLEPTLTFLPKSLLWRLTTCRASPSCSRLSIKFLVTFSPNQMLSLQPPHCQSPLPLFGCLFFNSTHRHPGILFSRHCCVISCVMAAVLMACRSAVSRVAATIEYFFS